MLCDGSPDPSVCQEINTFMSLWSEETKEDFQSVLNKSNQVLRVSVWLPQSRLVNPT